MKTTLRLKECLKISRQLSLVLCLTLTGSSARAVSDWVPDWGAQAGVVATNSPQSIWESAITYLEDRIGNIDEVVRCYHTPGSWWALTSTERDLIVNKGRKVCISFKPDSSWQACGGGNTTINNNLKSLAQSIAGIKPHRLMLIVWHEPENDINTTTRTPAQYAAMWQNVRSIFDANGADNVIWNLCFMSYANQNKWSYAQMCTYWRDMWPGNYYVDLLTWDAYKRGASDDWYGTLDTQYNWFVNNSDATHAYTSKPWGITEWGPADYWITGGLTYSDWSAFITSFGAELNKYHYPRFTFISYYDCLTQAFPPAVFPAYSNFVHTPYLLGQEPPQSIEPVVIRNPAGTLEVFAVHSSGGSVDHIAQNSPNGSWGNWSSLGGANVTKLAACVDKSTNTVVFGIVGTQVWYTYRLNGSANWSSWASLNSSGLYDIAAATNFDGGVELFANNTDGNLYHTWESTAGNPTSWHAWKLLGYTGATKGIVAGHDQNAESHVFCIGAGNALYHVCETNGGAWNVPYSMGGSITDLDVLERADGLLELFVVWSNGTIDYRLESAVNSPLSWGNWVVLCNNTDQGASNIKAINNGTNPAIFFIGFGHNIYNLMYNGSWPTSASNMSSQLSGTGQVSDNLAAGLNQDGRIELFIVAPDSQLYHKWQLTGGGWYANWFSSGGSEL